MKPRRMIGVLWEHLAAFALIAAAVAGFYAAHVNQKYARTAKEATKENAARIQDIQDSRIAACKIAYESVRQIFQPFLTTSTHPGRVRKFNVRIDELKASCGEQVRPKETP